MLLTASLSLQDLMAKAEDASGAALLAVQQVRHTSLSRVHG
jgi:hypothetical protein